IGSARLQTGALAEAERPQRLLAQLIGVALTLGRQFDDALRNNVLEGVGLSPVVDRLARLLAGLGDGRSCVTIGCRRRLHALPLTGYGLQTVRCFRRPPRLLLSRDETLNTRRMTRSRQLYLD